MIRHVELSYLLLKCTVVGVSKKNRHFNIKITRAPNPSSHYTLFIKFASYSPTDYAVTRKKCYENITQSHCTQQHSIAILSLIQLQQRRYVLTSTYFNHNRDRLLSSDN